MAKIYALGILTPLEPVIPFVHIMSLRTFFSLLFLFTGSFQKAGKFVLSSKLWEHSTPSKTCDVLITFPKATEDYTVMWLLSRLRARVPDVDVHVRQMAHSPVYGFYLTSSFEVIFNSLKFNSS